MMRMDELPAKQGLRIQTAYDAVEIGLQINAIVSCVLLLLDLLLEDAKCLPSRTLRLFPLAPRAAPIT